MTALRMLAMTPDPARLAHYAHHLGLMPRQVTDLGYPLHAALSAAFGELAPKPFRMIERARSMTLYGYGPATREALIDHAAVFGDPLACAALGLDSLAVKDLPEHWTTGRRYRFETRIWPTRRRGADEAEGTKARERDAFLLHLSQDPDASGMTARAQVYGAWLAERMRDAATLHPGPDGLPAAMQAFRRTRVARRTHGSDGRPLQTVEGPDAVLTGQLEVADGVAFAALLARGIGRHRAFGFGMLLLKPAA